MGRSVFDDPPPFSPWDEAEAPLIRILSADDHPLIRDGGTFALRTQHDLQLVAEAGWQ